MRSLAAVLLLAPLSASAAPGVCATSQSDGVKLVGSTVCFASQATCIALDGKTKQSVGKPALPPLYIVKAKQLCVGEVCKPLGKKLAAIIAKGEKAPPADPNMPAPFTLRVTDDAAFAALVIEGGADKDRVQIWNVAKDQRLALKAPVEYKKTGEKPSLWSAYAIGKTVEAAWLACAGPCAQGVVLDASGATKGAYFPGGPGVALDDTRLAIVPENGSGTITIVEAKTGKHLGELKLGDDAIVRTAVAKLDGDDFAALWDNGTTVSVSRISAPAGKPASIVWTQTIDACP